jgi:Ca-activated chloride channel family protein
VKEKTMKYDPDDPRLTAFVLGELDEDERAVTEALLKESVEARKAVEEIRSTVSALKGELDRENAPQLAPDQRERVLERAEGGAIPLRRRWVTNWRVWGLAASVLIVAGVGLFHTSVGDFLYSAWSSRQSKETVTWPEFIQKQGPGIPYDASNGTTSMGDIVSAGPGPPPGDVLRVGEGTVPSTVAVAKQLQALGYLEGPVLSGVAKYDEFSMDTPSMDQSVPFFGDIPIVGHLFKRSDLEAILQARSTGMDTLGGQEMNAFDVQEFFESESWDKYWGDLKEGFVSDATGHLLGIDPSFVERVDGLNGIDNDGDGLFEEIYDPDGNILALPPAGSPDERGTEAYDRIYENPFRRVLDNPLSTFSIDVDTASYANVRRFLNGGRLPPPDAVRIEEFVNYFTYDYEPPFGPEPFATHVEVAGCPWNLDHRLLRIGLKGKEVPQDIRPPSNLVFLLDVSGSMNRPEKLPLLKKSMQMLVEHLTEIDRVAIVVYAGASGLVLPSTSCGDKQTLLDALERLKAGGSTHGSAGIQLAYEVATDNFIKDGVNRVILCTDGDFNVGITDRGQLIRLIEEKAESGVFLSVLGFGAGNLKDSTMEQLADKGNGNYSYIDTLREGEKVLVEQMEGTLVTIAKDVKIQIEFNPAQILAYRLIGYENRMLKKEDFNDDTKDAGEIGAGHTVTALYELITSDRPEDVGIPDVDPLKYQKRGGLTSAAGSLEILTLKLRYKEPDGDTSKLIEQPVTDSFAEYSQASGDFKFAASVAAFGMILRNSEHKGNATLEMVAELAYEGMGADAEGYRAEFLELVKKADQLSQSR